MTQSPQSPRATSPLTARLYHLEYPRSLGVYSTYQEVQSVVDTLADNHFPVQSTLIVGTDLKLMERVTGRKTWGRVVGQGVLSGLWMGLFLGLLLLLITPGDLMIVVSSVVMGMVFFTVWSVIGYAMTGGKRDFTSMTATIPMQYELLVEHKHAEQARSILAESGAAPAPMRMAAPSPGHAAAPGQAPAPGQFPERPAVPRPAESPHRGTPTGYGTPAGPTGYGAQAGPAPAPGAASPSSAAPPRPSYGRPAAETTAPESARSARPSFGQPAGTPLPESASPAPSRGGDSFGVSPGRGEGSPAAPEEQEQDGPAR
ncbi:general stress protein [Brachybacterium sp.]|uniref:general stress protein n=1 Tax=Brachybacterium sp. TaxID=1891286 RepID=UPI002ED40E75